MAVDDEEVETADRECSKMQQPDFYRNEIFLNA
jgi:hypothetical protein